MRVVRRPMAALCAATLGILAAVVLPGTPAFADGIREKQWYNEKLDLAEIHKITQGEGIVVGLVDSGVDPNHPDLKGNVLPGIDVYNEKAKGLVPTQQHGTGMASIIAGHGHGPGNRDGILGIAPKAKILPVTIEKPGSLIQADVVGSAIIWLVNHGADLVSVSVSAPQHPKIDEAVEYAWKRRVPVIASVGNREDVFIGYPAKDPLALAVSSSDRKGGFSPQSIKAEETDLTAPGEAIQQAVPGGGYRTVDGTSSSTAIVAGAMALVRATHKDSKSLGLFNQIIETTKDVGPTGRDLQFGWGELDLKRAVTGQPDKRASRKRSAEPSEPVYAEPVIDDNDHDELIEAVVSLSVLALLIAGIVLIILAIRRRMRRRRAAAEAAAAAAAANSPPPPPGPATDTAPAADDAVWRPPST
ncbi:MAG: S8 family serine peptidase [Actinoplanes sp.]